VAGIQTEDGAEQSGQRRHGAQLSDDGIQVLSAAKKLRKLSLSVMKTVTAAGVDRLRHARPDLVIELK
jgi:hypothetical protein